MRKVEDYIDLLKPKVEALFKDDATGHDTTHLERTMKLALHISSKEGGDRVLVGISAYLHDVHRIMQSNLGRFVEPAESIPTIRELISDLDLSDDDKDEICNVIKNHENYNWNKGNEENSINCHIVQDADNLDALGAIGIIRTFVYGASVGRPMYDETKELEPKGDYVEGDKTDPSAVHHFYSKIFKLADHMNTATASKMAKEKVEFTKEFIKKFIAEWSGEI